MNSQPISHLIKQKKKQKSNEKQEAARLLKEAINHYEAAILSACQQTAYVKNNKKQFNAIYAFVLSCLEA